jgi:roadblock/LC7 domain-containing protein
LIALAKEAITEVAVVAVTKEQEAVQAEAVTEIVLEAATETVPVAINLVQAKAEVAQAAAVTVAQMLAALQAVREVVQAAIETVQELETKNYYSKPEINFGFATTQTTFNLIQKPQKTI